MSLPYENATSGDRAIADIEKILRGFGCKSFGSMMQYDTGERIVQFEYRGRQVSVRASARGYATAWLRDHPYKAYGYGKTRTTEAKHNQRAMDIGTVAVCSVLRDWIKGQITAVETGILTFEGAFLGQLLLSDGKTVLETVEERKMLPAPQEQK